MTAMPEVTPTTRAEARRNPVPGLYREESPRSNSYHPLPPSTQTTDTRIDEMMDTQTTTHFTRDEPDGQQCTPHPSARS